MSFICNILLPTVLEQIGVTPACKQALNTTNAFISKTPMLKDTKENIITTLEKVGHTTNKCYKVLSPIVSDYARKGHLGEAAQAIAFFNRKAQLSENYSECMSINPNEAIIDDFINEINKLNPEDYLNPDDYLNLDNSSKIVNCSYTINAFMQLLYEKRKAHQITDEQLEKIRDNLSKITEFIKNINPRDKPLFNMTGRYIHYLKVDLDDKLLEYTQQVNSYISNECMYYLTGNRKVKLLNDTQQDN